MANGNNDTTIRIGLDADLSGGVQTEKQLDNLKHKAAQLGKDGSASVGKVTGAVGGLQKACGLLRNVLTGFGVAGAIMGLFGAIEKVRTSFGAAKKEAEKLARAREEAERKETVEALAKSYEELGKSIGKVTEAAQRANEVQDIATKNARALQDAELDLAEQKELAAVDANDPAVSEKRAAISARYAEQRSRLASTRSREDVAAEFNRLNADAVAKREAATKIEASTSEDDAVIERTKKARDEARRRSRATNDEDTTNAGRFGRNIKNIVTFNWGKVSGDLRTEEGDAVRKEAYAEADRLDAEVKRLEEQKKAKLAEAERLRGDADHIVKRANAVIGALDAVNVRERATEVSARRGVSDTEASLVKKNREIKKKAEQKEKDELTVSEGTEKLSEYERQETTEKAKAQAAADKYQKEQNEVFAAQNRYDMLVQNGGSKKEKSAALAALQKEKAEALEAQHEMEKVAAEVANVLKAIKEEVGTLSRSVKAAQSRLKQNEADAPEG